MCIKCGYYLKDYDHSADLSVNLTSSVLGSNQDLANYLSSGFWEDYGTVPRKFNLSEDGINPKNGVITYNTSGNSFDNNGINKDRSFLVDEAFNILEASMGFNFQKINQKADINFGDKYTNSAFAYADGRSFSLGLDFVNINIGSNWNSGKSSLGDYTFQTILHEIGHSLGLGHLGSYNGSGNYSDDSIFINDSWQSSIMSYFSQIQNSSTNASFAFLTTYMNADWTALDYIYSSDGFSTANAFAGDTTYGFNTNITQSKSVIYSEMSNLISKNAYTLVDGSGIDTVDFSGFLSDQLIDLRETNLNSNNLYASNIGGKIGNLTIASGTIIENANGGGGEDTIRGNNAANTLKGENDADKLYGNNGNDKLYGGKGNDLLNGGLGNDRLVGGEGVDTAVFSSKNNRINLGSTSRQNTRDGQDILTGIENVNGGGGNDIIRGNSDANTFRGGSGNDKLHGFAGVDKLYGLTGADILYGGGQNDLLHGGNGVDKLYGGGQNDLLYGGNGVDKLYGQAGDDILNGGKGNDTFYGGAGNDTFQINKGPGRDLITDYDTNEADSIELLGGLTEGDLTFKYVGGDTRIKYGNDLMAIVQNTIAEDITFI